MENKIIERVKFLMFHFGKDLEESIYQAIEEVADKEELNDIYRMYDISKPEYTNYIKRKLKGEI